MRSQTTPLVPLSPSLSVPALLRMPPATPMLLFAAPASGSSGSHGGSRPDWPTLPRRYATTRAQPAMQPRKRQRLPWLLGLSLLAFVAALDGWLYFQTTPAYSLALLVDAAQRDDAAALDAVVDTEQVADGFVQQALQRAAGQYAPGLAAVLSGGADALAPAARAVVKQLLCDEIRREVKEEAGGPGVRPFVLVALATRYRVKVEEDGDTAKAFLNLKGRPVELTLRRADEGRWRVTAVKDEMLVARVAESVLKVLPGAASDGPIRERLNNKLPEELPNLLLPNGK